MIFESFEIRDAFVGAIVEWVSMSYSIDDPHVIADIQMQLSSLGDEDLYRAGQEIEVYEYGAKEEMIRIERQISVFEHSLEESSERSMLSLPIFS